MALLDEIRQKNPSLRDTSDDDIKSLLRQSPEFKYFDDEEFNAFVSGAPENEAQSGSPGFLGGISAGIDQMQAMGGGLIMAAGEAMESQGVLNAGRDIYQRNMEQAGENDLGFGFTDIRSAGDAWNWARYTAGNQLPMLAASVAGGGVGGLTARALAGATLKEGAKRTSQAIGAAGASTGMETGALMGETEDLDVSLAHGLVMGSLDAITPIKLLRAAGKSDLADQAASEISDRVLADLQRDAARSTRNAAGRGSLTNFMAESTTEGLQGLIGQHANYWVENNGDSLLANLGEVDLKAFVDEAAAGGLMGGVAGAPAGVMERNQSRAQVDRITQAREQVASQGGDALDQATAGLGAEQQSQTEQQTTDSDPEARAQRQQQANEVGLRIQRNLADADELRSMARGASYEGSTRLRSMAMLVKKAEDALEAGRIEQAGRHMGRAELVASNLRSALRTAGTRERPMEGELADPEAPQAPAGLLRGRQGQLPPGTGDSIRGESPQQFDARQRTQQEQADVLNRRSLGRDDVIYGEGPTRDVDAEQRRRRAAFEQQYGTAQNTGLDGEYLGPDALPGRPNRQSETLDGELYQRPGQLGQNTAPRLEQSGTIYGEGTVAGNANTGLDQPSTRDPRFTSSPAREETASPGSGSPAQSLQFRTSGKPFPSQRAAMMSRFAREAEQNSQTATPVAVDGGFALDIRPTNAPAAPASSSTNQEAKSQEVANPRGEAIDSEWSAFSPDSGTRGIPRAEMPQVKAESRGALANFLSARGIEGNQETVAASSLKPTQAEFSEARVQAAKDRKEGDRAILVSSDGHVVDGHHQWLAKADQGDDVRIIRLSAPIDEVLDQVREFPSTEADAPRQTSPQAERADADQLNQEPQPARKDDGVEAEDSNRQADTAAEKPQDPANTKAEIAEPTGQQESTDQSTETNKPKRRNKPLEYTGFSGEERSVRSYQEVGDYRIAKVNDSLYEVIGPSDRAVSQMAGPNGAAQEAARLSGLPVEDQRYAIGESDARPVSREAIEEALAGIPEFEGTKVIKSANELPWLSLAFMEVQGVDPQLVRGLFVGDDMYVIADNVDSIEQAISTAVHEAVGHKGMRAVLGADLERVMLNLYRNLPNSKEGREALREVEELYPFLDSSKREDRVKIGEEMVAHLLEKGHRPKAWQRAVAKIRELLRQLFPSVGWTYTDALALGERSRDHLRKRQAESAPARENSYAMKSKADKGVSAQEIAEQLRARYPGLKLDLTGSREVVTVARIELPQGSREQGSGTEVMRRLAGWADANDKVLALSPSGDFGGNKRRLKAFYQRLGFVENKGSNRDYAISETMHRLPESAQQMYALRAQQRVNFEDAFEDFTDKDRKAASKHGDRTPRRRISEWYREITARGMLKIRQGLVDRYAALREMDETLYGADFAEGDDIRRSGWVLARMSNAANGALHTLLHNGRIQLDAKERVITPMEDNSKGLGAVLGELGEPAEIQRFMGWIAGNRADKLRQQGRENLFDMDDIDAMKTWNRGQTKAGRNRAELYQKVFADFQQYRDDVLAIAEQSGILGKGMTERQAFYSALNEFNISKPLRERLKRQQKSAESADTPAAKQQAEERAAATMQQIRDLLSKRKGSQLADFDAHVDSLQKSQRELWGEEFYVPFYRLSEEKGAPTGQIATGGLSRQQAYKRLKGGTQNLNDLLQNTMMNFHHLLDASLKNQAASQAIENAKALGMAERVPESNRNEKTSTFVLEDGQKVYYDIDDPMVYTALTSLTHAGMNSTLMRIMRGFKRVFTNSVTITPQFIAANLIRDSIQATATNEVSKNALANVLTGWKSFKDAKVHAQLMASGGAFNFGHLYGNNPDELRAQMTRSMRNAKVVGSAGSGWGHIATPIDAVRAGWTWWNDINNTTENVNRAAIYTQNKEKGALKAAFESRDLIDFSAHGAWPAVRILIDIVPFLNARIQGLDKIYRSGLKPGTRALREMFGGKKASISDKQAAGRFWAVTGAVTMAALALYLHNYDDERYEALEEWEKDTYWHLFLGSAHLVIPKPFEVGAIATLAERFTEQFVNDKATGELFAQRMGHMLHDTFSFTIIPQMVQPAFDVYANKDSFTGRPIEGMGMDRLSPELRKRYSTSKLGTGLSQLLNSTVGAIGDPDSNPAALSPVQVDHLIQGYIGALGGWMMGATDTAVRFMQGESAPSKRLYEYQPIRRFYSNLNDVDPFTRYGTVFYEGLREAGRAYSDVKELRELGRLAEAAESAQSNRELLQLRPALNRAQRRLSTLNQRIEIIQRSNLDGQTKRQRIDRIQAMKVQIQRLQAERIEEARGRG